jgi:hypothetical protein
VTRPRSSDTPQGPSRRRRDRGSGMRLGRRPAPLGTPSKRPGTLRCSLLRQRRRHTPRGHFNIVR